MKYGKFTNKYVLNKHTEESVNFPVTKRILTSMFFSLRSLGAKIRVNIYSLKLIYLIFHAAQDKMNDLLNANAQYRHFLEY